MFQEGHDILAESAFREVAKLSGGAYMRFDQGSAAELAKLLAAVAKYASGGLKALDNGRDRTTPRFAGATALIFINHHMQDRG